MKKKNMWITVICISVLLFIVGVSYAYWSLTFTQKENNVVMSDCFEIEFLEGNAINLLKAHPISDEEGLKNIPYTFTIENTCSMKATYQVNLEEMMITSKRLRNQYIKVSLNEKKGKLLSEEEEVETTLENADISHKLTSGVLKPKEKKTYELRIWMEESTPAIEEVMNASFESKITIQTIANESIPEVETIVVDQLNEITVDMNTLQNEKNELLKYYYQLNDGSLIESEESSYTFSNLSDGTYKLKVRVETRNGIILEEKEMEVSIAYEIVYVSSDGNDEKGNGSIENPYQTLQPAYNKVKSGGEVVLLSNITATTTTSMNIENKEVVIRSNGNEVYSVYRGDNLKTQILDISNSNTVTTTNIIFDGRNVEANKALLYSSNSTLNLNEGTRIQNGYTIGSISYGGGIYIKMGTVNITGATITNNRTYATTGYSQGGGIYGTSSNITFNSGLISNNQVTASPIIAISGGGIMLWNGNFIMNGGDIKNNYSSNLGGGVYVGGDNGNSTVTMTNGNITQNSSNMGGGLSLYKSVAYIKGGTISNNTANKSADIYTENGAQIIY